jgi:hypothetical protein
MRDIFAPDPFDIAPGASGPTKAGWLVLALGVLFLGLCTWLLVQSMARLEQAEELGRATRRQLHAQEQASAALREKQSDPAVQEKSRAQRKLRETLGMSWSGLFDALEAAADEVDGGTAVLALVPTRGEAESARVSITALAVSSDVMIEYVDALAQDPHVREVQLLTQQPAADAGVNGVRFKIAVVWEPLGVQPLPSQTVAEVQAGAGKGAK